MKYNLFHIGGREGGIGKAEYLTLLGDKLAITVFEANLGEDKTAKIWMGEMRQYIELGAEVSVMEHCLSNCVGKGEFYINVDPTCSSLFKIAPSALNYSRMTPRGKQIWGESCRPVRTIGIDITTLDKLYADGVIELPDFLSIDAQGAEYNILLGASKALEGDLMGVISEVEFRELYENQPLFSDQFNLLKEHQFNLVDFYNPEYWYSDHPLGKGVLIDAEALFLRDLHYFIKKDKEPNILFSNLAKLAVTAFCFDRRSYAFQILNHMGREWPKEWKSYLEGDAPQNLFGLIQIYEGLWRIQYGK